jgi:hypothetical protein
MPHGRRMAQGAEARGALAMGAIGARAALAAACGRACPVGVEFHRNSGSALRGRSQPGLEAGPCQPTHGSTTPTPARRAVTSFPCMRGTFPWTSASWPHGRPAIQRRSHHHPWQARSALERGFRAKRSSRPAIVPRRCCRQRWAAAGHHTLLPIEPEVRRIPGEIAPRAPHARNQRRRIRAVRATPRRPGSPRTDPHRCYANKPSEPEARRHPGEIASAWCGRPRRLQALGRCRPAPGSGPVGLDDAPAHPHLELI